MNAEFIEVVRPVAERVGWTLVHSTWEGAAVAGGLWVVLAVVGRERATRRYAACCAGMGMVGVAMGVTFRVMGGGGGGGWGGVLGGMGRGRATRRYAACCAAMVMVVVGMGVTFRVMRGAARVVVEPVAVDVRLVPQLSGVANGVPVGREDERPM